MGLFADLKWQPALGDPTLQGWLCVVAYGFATVFCVRAASNRSEPAEFRWIWWSLALVLIFLGINKQLDFQTLFIELGRKAARAGGWYERRRAVQAIFVALLGLIVALGLVALLVKARGFFRAHPLTGLGALLLLGIILIRIATLNHALGPRLGDKYWGWAVELAGNLCIMASAARTRAQRDHPRSEQ